LQKYKKNTLNIKSVAEYTTVEKPVDKLVFFSRY